MTLVISKGITLDNGTRAAAIAGVSPTLDYRFAREKREIETVSLTDKLTFTGGNQGTFTGSDGFVQRATTNVPRFDHDPLSRRSLGLLVEEQRTNLLVRSEEFDNAAWTKVRAAVSANTTTAPDGTLTADTGIEDTSASSTHNPLLQGSIIVANGTYTASLYVRAKERSRGAIDFSSTDSANFVRGQFNLGAGTIASSSEGTGSGASASISNAGGGWFRVSITGSIGGSLTTGRLLLRIADAAGSIVYTGDGTSGIYVWGAQLEAGAFPTSYIPTTTTTVTRTADSAVIDGTGILTGTYTLVEKPAGCAVVSGTNINLQPGFTAERVMVFPAALDAGQITAIRGAM
jgi:hypothetical protein